MAGFVAIGNNKYIGTCKASTPLQNGMFVAADFSDNTVLPSSDRTEVAYFVENVIDTVDEQQIDDLDFTVAVGDYARIKRLVQGEIFVTDQVDGSVSVDANLDAHDNSGKLSATAGTPNQKFKVIEKPTMWGKTVYKCLVL